MISSFEDLKKSYVVLKKNQHWQNLASDGFGMVVIFAMIPVVMLISSFNPFNLILFIAGVITTTVYGVLIYKVYRYRNKPTLENHTLIFLQFFEPYEQLHKLKQCYLLEQSELYETNKKSAISAIDSLVLSIESWVSRSAPTELIKIQTEIKNILEKNIIQTIKVVDNKKFCNFADYFLQTCNTLHKRDLTYDEWINFKEKIFEYGTKFEDESTIQKTNWKFMIQSYAWSKEVIGATVWVISFMAMLLFGQQFIIALIGSATIAGAAAFIFSKQILPFDKSKKPHQN